MPHILTADQLQERCLYWQERLRLRDWDVVVEVVRAARLQAPGAGFLDGGCDWTLANKTAYIRILDPVDYPESAFEPQDMEQTLVHELLHLHFGPFFGELVTSETQDLTQIAKETAIEMIARALVQVAREQQQAA